MSKLRKSQKFRETIFEIPSVSRSQTSEFRNLRNQLSKPGSIPRKLNSSTRNIRKQILEIPKLKISRFSKIPFKTRNSLAKMDAESLGIVNQLIEKLIEDNQQKSGIINRNSERVGEIRKAEERNGPKMRNEYDRQQRARENTQSGRGQCEMEGRGEKRRRNEAGKRNILKTSVKERKMNKNRKLFFIPFTSFAYFLGYQILF